MHWLALLIPIAVYLFIVLRDAPHGQQQMKQKVADSLVALLECPQTGKPLVTDWTISVSDEMRQQLYSPLTHDIVHTITTTKKAPQESRFIYRCVSCHIGSKEIAGTVEITIDYVNKSCNLDLHYHFAPVQLQLTLAGAGKGWELSQVKHP